MIKRSLNKVLEEKLFKGKVFILVGARQVGKTTLIKEIEKKYSGSSIYLSGDESDIRMMFQEPTSTKLKSIIGNNKLVIIDEAQLIENIGLSIKLLIDNSEDIQIIATGSSSFDLKEKVKEPLTGRKYEYILYPLCFKELVEYTSFIEEKRLLESRLIYGCYPEIITKQEEAKELLKLISDSYLYKDILAYERIKKPEKLEKLLQALALQIGNEVKFHEIGQIIGTDNETVERYINILEKAFVIFRLPSLSRNRRNELKKSRKIYFYDNGIRNAIINNFNPLPLRQDVGSLWENFLIVERIKYNHYHKVFCNYFFWRTHSQSEIDFIEERDGKLYAFEFKWNAENKNIRVFNTFLQSYSNAECSCIDRNNFVDFVVPKSD